MNPLSVKGFPEALACVLEAAAGCRMQAEGCALPDLVGRVLAEQIDAPNDLPMADNSAMDGYCVKVADLVNSAPDNPITLPVSGHIDAGCIFESLLPGSTAYIATGGLIPTGADSVIKLEDVAVSPDGGSVKFSAPAVPGAFIRRRGQDMTSGDPLLERGTFISPYIAGMIAASGKTVAAVARKPRVCLLTSGDELVMPFDIPQPWQVRNSNSTILAALIHRAGGHTLDLGIVRDDPRQARLIIERALTLGDVLITSGGISMGRKDPMIAAFQDMGIMPRIHGVSMKPGKPFFFSLSDGKPIFGLPGNQASSTVTFELFVRPFLARMLDRTDPDHPVLHLPIKTTLQNPTGRDHFVRGVLENTTEGTWARPLSHQDSHLLSSLAGFSLLIRHVKENPVVKAGTVLPCLLIS